MNIIKFISIIVVCLPIEMATFKIKLFELVSFNSDWVKWEELTFCTKKTRTSHFSNLRQFLNWDLLNITEQTILQTV
jgi:uncharacterized membrane protein YccF (DUF307 family)